MQLQAVTLSSGVWKQKDLIAAATGFSLSRHSWFRTLSQSHCVLGWGYKPTAQSARDLAYRTGRSYVAVEDGWLRSVVAGSKELPRSLVFDKSAVYYAADRCSDLETLISSSSQNFDARRLHRARQGMRLLKRTAISKYNDGPWLTEQELGLSPRNQRRRVLVVDQTFGDASVVHGGANRKTFDRMLQAAATENPDAEIVVKLHPDVVDGRKRGYLTKVDRQRFKVIDRSVNPWALLALVDHVYVVTSQLGCEALIAGLNVSCFGAPFYSGWGLTDDRIANERRTARPTIEQLFAAVYFDYPVYIDPNTNQRTTFEGTVTALTAARAEFMASRGLQR